MTFSSQLYPRLLWRLFLDACSRGTFFLVNILIARSLGVGEYGKFAYAVSLSQIFYIFTDMGSHLQLIKELGEVRGKEESRWVGFLELKTIFFALCFIVYLLLVPLLWHWDYQWLPVLALLWMFSNSMLDFNQFVCNGLGRMDLASNIMFIQRFMTLLGTAFSILFFRTLPGVMIGVTLGAVSGSIVSNWFFHRRVSAPTLSFRNFKEWKRIIFLSIPHGIGGAFGSWYLRIGFIVLGWLATNQIIGEYSTAFRIFEITYIVPAAIMSVGVPHLSEAFRDGHDAFSHELKRISFIMLPLAVIWMLVLTYGSGFIIKFVYGAPFMGAVPILKVFGPVGGMVFLNYVVTHLMVVLNFQKRHAVHQILIFIVCLLLNVILIPNFSALGAAGSLLMAEIALFLITTVYLLRRYKGYVARSRAHLAAESR